MASHIERSTLGNVYLYFEPENDIICLASETRQGTVYHGVTDDSGSANPVDDILAFEREQDPGAEERLRELGLDLCKHGVPRHLCALGCGERDGRLFGGQWPGG